MGRLDDHSKRRIVELRRAGLSFRKIKKVLELDDIRVTPQAVYLFLKRRSGEPAAGWHGEQPWQGREAEPPRLPGTGAPAVPPGHPTASRAPCSAGSQDAKDGVRVVSVASLCKGRGHLGDTLPVGNGDDSSTGTPVAPGGTAALSPPLPGRGQPRNPALLGQTVAADRAVLLQHKVKDASTQTALGAEHHSLAWGVPVPPAAASPQAMAEKLDAVQTEVQRLSQALHVVLERQCRLERQQEQQQRLQQEVLVTLQQLSCSVSHGAVPATQPCSPFGTVAEPSPSVPNFSQFKMELI